MQSTILTNLKEKLYDYLKIEKEKSTWQIQHPLVTPQKRKFLAN